MCYDDIYKRGVCGLGSLPVEILVPTEKEVSFSSFLPKLLFTFQRKGRPKVSHKQARCVNELFWTDSKCTSSR